MKSMSMQQLILQKKEQKEKILKKVKDMRIKDEELRYEKLDKYLIKAEEKDKKICEDKNKMISTLKRKGQDKNDKIVFRTDEAYKKMEEWKQELERREKTAEDNLRKQQRQRQEHEMLKKELLRLK